MDFLFEPWFLAMFGTLAGGVLMKAADNFSSKAKEVEAKQSPNPKAVVTKTEVTEFDCKVYDTHIFEKKLAEGGVLERKEITLCDDEACPLCKPERIWRGMDAKVAWQREEIAADPEGWERFQELKRKDPRWKGYTYHDYKFQMKIKHDRQKAIANQKAEQQALAAKNKATGGMSGCASCGVWLPSISQYLCADCNAHSRREDENDFVKSLAKRMKNQPVVALSDHGMSVVPIRPAEVPEYAHYEDIRSLRGDTMRIWKWIDSDTGKSLALRQVITEQSLPHSFKTQKITAGTISTGPR